MKTREEKNKKIQDEIIKQERFLKSPGLLEQLFS